MPWSKLRMAHSKLRVPYSKLRVPWSKLWSVPVEAWFGLLEASRMQPTTSSGPVEASIGIPELPDDPHARSSASLEALNASLEASSGVFQVRSAAFVATTRALQTRPRPPPTSRGILERTTVAFGTTAAPQQETVSITRNGGPYGVPDTRGRHSASRQ